MKCRQVNYPDGGLENNKCFDCGSIIKDFEVVKVLRSGDVVIKYFCKNCKVETFKIADKKEFENPIK